MKTFNGKKLSHGKKNVVTVNRMCPSPGCGITMRMHNGKLMCCKTKTQNSKIAPYHGGISTIKKRIKRINRSTISV